LYVRKVRYARELKAKEKAEEEKLEAKRLKLEDVVNTFKQDYKLDDYVALNLAQLLIHAEKETDDFLAKCVAGLVPTEDVGRIMQIGPNVVRLSPESWAELKKMVGDEKGLPNAIFLSLLFLIANDIEVGTFPSAEVHDAFFKPGILAVRFSDFLDSSSSSSCFGCRS
jgi:hypothetical protein